MWQHIFCHLEVILIRRLPPSTNRVKQHHIKLLTMDYEGQRLSELLFQWIICSFGAVGWVIGYINQDFYQTFYAWLVGVVISVIVSSLRQFPYSKDFTPAAHILYFSFVFQIGHTSIDILSSGWNRFQIDDKETNFVGGATRCENGEEIVF